METTDRRQGVRTLIARVGVVACVAVVGLVGAGRLDDTVAIFDFRADAHAAASYEERTYPHPWVAGSPQVLEEARLWMPEDAEYRVIRGPEPSTDGASGFAHDFLRTLLLPRTQTESERAPWVFCYGCSPAFLGSGYEVLSASEEGLLFARRLA